MDDRLHIINRNKLDIYVAYLIVSKEKRIEEKSTVKILRGEDKTIGIMSNWDAKLEKNDGKKLKVIIFYTNFELLENHYKTTSSSIILDSLYDIGECKYREYSYEELEKKNWRVIYPDDKFSSVLSKLERPRSPKCSNENLRKCPDFANFFYNYNSNKYCFKLFPIKNCLQKTNLPHLNSR